MPNSKLLEADYFINRPICQSGFNFLKLLLNTLSANINVADSLHTNFVHCFSKAKLQWRQPKFGSGDSRDDSRPFTLLRHLSLQSLLMCQTQGCTFCEWLMMQIPEPDLASQSNDLVVFFMLVTTPLEVSQFRLCGNLPDSHQVVEYCNIKLVNLDSSFLEAGTSQPENYLGYLPRALPPRDSIGEIVKNANRLLSHCTSSHEKCATEIPDSMPTRVIDLGTPECPNLSLISSNKTTPQHYAIMTYRWGTDGGAYKLLEVRLEEYHRGIPEPKLPSTLIDVINFTRAIGIRYLWIDALCILQDEDSRTDWNIEAPKMREYYRSAYFCVSTLCAPSVEYKLFECCAKDRDFELAELEGVRVGLTSCETETQELEIFDDRLRSFDIAFRSSPLNFRGWTLQERLLSQRLLHIGRHQIYLECSTSEASERDLYADKHREPPPTRGTFLPLSKFAEIRTQLEEIPENLSQERILECWYELVMAYGPREVTEEKDRLMAFDGLRMLFQLGMKCRYFYGIWEADICNGLLWFNGTYGFIVHKQCGFDPDSINLFDVDSSTDTNSGGSSSGGSFTDVASTSSWMLGTREQPRQFWYGHSFQRQQLGDQLQADEKEKDVEAIRRSEIQSWADNSVDDCATSIPLSSSLPTWSWASCSAPYNSCVVETPATIKLGHRKIPRVKVDVIQLGHMEVSGAMKPFIAIRATIARIELVQGRAISSLRYPEAEQGGQRSVIARGASSAYLDREPSEPSFTTPGLIMYESGYKKSTLDQSVLTLLLIRKVQSAGQEYIEAGSAENQVYERIGLAFFRHKKTLQPQMDESKVNCRETVYLV